ncbi:MAG: TetR/AcrR family transcriptional regulator [Thermodesulfobacteriota bacterium]
MPPQSRDASEVAAVRNRILDMAEELLSRHGFEGLSMRRIAARMEMTATNLYYYFLNKDEIYLAIQTRGFARLAERFEELEREHPDPLERLYHFTVAYCTFGFENAGQYAIMFTMNTPKYADYVGTKLEEQALFEKNTALRVAEITARAIAQTAERNPGLKLADPMWETVKAWIMVHGLVSLSASRVLQEVVPDISAAAEKLARDLLASWTA